MSISPSLIICPDTVADLTKTSVISSVETMNCVPNIISFPYSIPTAFLAYERT